MAAKFISLAAIGGQLHALDEEGGLWRLIEPPTRSDSYWQRVDVALPALPASE